MRTSSVVAASAALVAGANAWGNVTYVTEVVNAYTTYCPSSTEVVHGTKTYTVTKATTLVITDCPCTVTKPIITKPVVPSTTPEVVVSTKVVESSVPAVFTSSLAVPPSDSHSVPVVHISSPVVSASVPIGTAPAGSVTVPVIPPHGASSPVGSVPVGTGVPSLPSQGPNQPPIFYNSTVAVPSQAGTGTPAAPPVGSATSTGKLPVFTGAANRAFAASGAGLVGVLGLFAYVL